MIKPPSRQREVSGKNKLSPHRHRRLDVDGPCASTPLLFFIFAGIGIAGWYGYHFGPFLLLILVTAMLLLVL